VVFADEPTGALDQATGAEVMRLLTSATAAVGASLVLVTHDDAVAAWCSRRIHVRDGWVLDGSAPLAPAAPGTDPHAHAAGAVR
jgi:putative ABC transport system ATP-binding protein